MLPTRTQNWGAESLGSGRNTIVAILSGFLFACGWWIIIDAAVRYDATSLPRPNHAIGSMATIGFILLNAIPESVLLGDSESPISSKLCVFFCLLLNFATFIAAIWVMFASYVTGRITPVWPGVAIFLQNLLILSASAVFRFGRSHDAFGL